MFTLLFIAFLLADVALRLWLATRQIRYVQARRGEVPAEFAAKIGLYSHQRAADYTVARMQLSILERVVDAAVLVGLTLLGGLQYLNVALGHAIGGDMWRQLALIGCVLAILGLVSLPFSLWRRFRLEARFGFNRMTPGMFVLDALKGIALQLALGIPLLYGFFAVERAIPGIWWLVSWAGFMIIMLAMIVIYPTFIAPLFNKFTPMPDTPLKAQIEALLQKCGFESKGLFVMDASKRSTHGNAYFSGLGKAKRIVFFDTLLQKHDEPEILSILAHELGHFKFGHIKEKLIESAVLTFIVFAVLAWAFAGGLAHAFALPDDPGLVLVIVMFAMGPFAQLLSPLTNFLSRRAEFQADGFAKGMFGPGPMISALTKLSRDNLSTLTPDRLYALFYYSHPPVPERIAHLESA